jgi:AcrR family transcriptional regulator
MEKSEETRERILEAAESLFIHYGFSKTTMAEIAGKCGMSAANIYRFFEGKEEIVAEMAYRHFRKVEESLREVVRRPGIAPTERLEAFVLVMVRQAHDLCCCNERMNEAVGYIQRKRAEMVDRHWERIRSLLAEILAEGNRSGEFDAPDVVDSADAVLKATSFFQAPQCFVQLSLSDLEESAGRVVRLIVKGLRKG